MEFEVLSTRDIQPGLKRLVDAARRGRFPGLVLHCRIAEEALTILRLALRPDFLVLNPEIPWRGEVEVLKAVRETRLPTKVVAIVPRLDSPQAAEIAKLGPAAMISREMAPDALIEALNLAFRSKPSGEGTVSPDRDLPRDQAAEAWAEGLQLTRREIEVARLASRGLHDREIAALLYVTEGTVKGHLHEIYQKLNVRGRNDLTRYCMQRSWG